MQSHLSASHRRKRTNICIREDTDRQGKRRCIISSSSTRSSSNTSITSATTTTSSSTVTGIKDPEEPTRKINVLPADLQWWQERFAKRDVYKNDTDPRGPILIVNNKENRPGSEADEEKLVELFRQIGYEHSVKDFSSKEVYQQNMESFREIVENNNFDSLVVAFISHGDSQGRLLTAKGEPLHVGRSYKEFDASNLPSFEGKPKLFIFVACCNPMEQNMLIKEATMLAAKYDKKKTLLSDTFGIFSTVPGYVSKRDTCNGSFFTDALTTVFEPEAKDSHLYELIQKITPEFEERKVTQQHTMEVHGSKWNFYLNPIGSKDYHDTGSSSMGYSPPPASDNQSSDSDSSRGDGDDNNTSNREDNNKDSNDKPSGSREDNATRKQRSYSNKEGMVLFFNYIAECENDVGNLKAKLSDLGWTCRDIKVKAMRDFRRELKRKKEDCSGTIIVFFFGYGYEDQLFLGSSSTEESLSYEVFCHELNKFQKEGDAIILFTNTCFKKPETNTYEYVEIQEVVKDVFHFCTEVNGTCQEGSLMTHILLNEMKDSHSDFAEMATNLAIKINEYENWGEDEYYSYWKCYGVVSSISVPSLKALPTTSKSH